MLLFHFRRIVLATTVAVGVLAAAPLWAQRHGGGHSGHGHSGHGHSGHGHSGHGHSGHGHSGHGHSGHGHSGHGHSGHVYHGGGHYGGGFYGSNVYSGRGFSLSIGGGYPYGYGGFGYGSLGYGGIDYGIDTYRYPSSSYSTTYRGFAPDYFTQPSLSYTPDPVYGEVPVDSYGTSYRYDGAIESPYGVPGYSSEFQHQPRAVSPYAAGRVDPSSADLRPGMVLEDGSTVISVAPPGVVSGEPATVTESDEPSVAPKADSQPDAETQTKAAPKLEPTPAKELDSDVEVVPTPAEVADDAANPASKD
ncbi:hypothetical protein Pla52o_19810 [Novipirellula galeiformis]|uniref:Uncharacterized protein n=1 Tax=Novipirellula galeiformis TaxID=2528004 RepID=A0A5C6CI18_9BACT|nr:hypothetical protein [Novipirellula galeiformis]TWU24058.1 hypothetical protein Pla52o_19810 [Novipirellula galeiformis]